MHDDDDDGKWLRDWLIDIGDRNIAPIECTNRPSTRGVDGDGDGGSSHSVWITVIAAILAVVSIAILIAIACLYMEDGRHIRHAANGQLSYTLL